MSIDEELAALAAFAADLPEPTPHSILKTVRAVPLEGNFPLDPVMAIDPMAFEQSFFPFLMDEESAKPYAMNGDVAVVKIQGPLSQRGGWFWDGYDKIRSRFEKALEDPKVRAVTLQIDSPGGAVAGLFETARAMRRAAADARKPVIAYADELAASAGYALASVADEIYLPESGTVGSVGVISVLADRSKLNERMGVRVHVLTTGKHKGDGHPDKPLTDEVIARYQERVNALGAQFNEMVADARGVSPAYVKGLEAAVFHGAAAVKGKLANGVASFDEVLRLAGDKAKASRSSGRRQEKPMNTEKATAAGGTVGGEVLLSAPPAQDLKAIAISVGLSHDASEQAILETVASTRRDLAELQRLTGKSNVSDALGAVQAGQIAIGQLESAQREIAVYREASTAHEVETLIEAGKRDGKITSDGLESELRALGRENPGRLKTVLGTLPALVTRRQDATREPPTEAALTELELQVAKQMGIKPADLAKAKNAPDTAQEGV